MIDILTEFGFGAIVTNLIFRFISAANIIINVNGEKTEKILTLRGLRQRDPLSSIIFTLCIVYLDQMIQEAGVFTPGPNTRGRDVEISRLLFADDFSFLSRTKKKCLARIQMLIQRIRKEAGLDINTNKSYYLSMRGTVIEMEGLEELEGIRRGSYPVKILGFWFNEANSLKTHFNEEMSKMTNFVDNWINRKMGTGS